MPVATCFRCDGVLTLEEALRSPRICAKCRATMSEEELSGPMARERARLRKLLDTFPQYTTSVEGDFTTLGIVTGIAVMGTNIFAEMMASVSDIFGGRSGAYQREFRSGRDHALAEMCDQAQQRGAELVAGVRFDYEAIGKMLMISASGTALVRSSTAV